MTTDLAASKPAWATALREHARRHTPAGLGLGLALLVVLEPPWADHFLMKENRP